MTTETGSSGLELVDGARMRGALHDLSQPLTTLECMLYLQRVTAKKMIRDAKAAEEVYKMMGDALQECGRMMAVMSTMRDCLEMKSGRT